jgi:N-acetylglucosaminyldiphosphoundecaprenol N-acetyl-beta-D-mannosaminyltransferase
MSTVVHAPSQRIQPDSRVTLLGCSIDNLSFEEAVSRIHSFITSGNTHRYFALNIHKVAAFRHVPDLLRIANESDLVTADGTPIVWLSRWLGKPLKERVTGADLMDGLIALAAKHRYKVYFLGANAPALDAAISKYKQCYPNLRIAGYRHGYWEREEEASIIKDIQDAQPDILFLGISSPKKELFMDTHFHELNVPFMMGVGGAFDIAAGVTKRAPIWMQRNGLEWFWRVLQEPGRMWKRYLADGIAFLFAIGKEVLKR